MRREGARAWRTDISTWLQCAQRAQELRIRTRESREDTSGAPITQASRSERGYGASRLYPITARHGMHTERAARARFYVASAQAQETRAFRMTIWSEGERLRERSGGAT